MKSLVFLSWLFMQAHAIGNNIPGSSKEGSSVRREIIKSSILDEPKCEEVRRLCPGQNEDFIVLECLQSIDPRTLNGLNPMCQNAVWSHTHNLIGNTNVRNILMTACSKVLPEINCPLDETAGSYLKCIVNNKEAILDTNCLSLVIRIENIAFFDYRWISSFLDHCKLFIDKFKCGRIDSDGFSQSRTITCLQTHSTEVDETCTREILRLSEIQAESIKRDHQLYVACADDHMRYCQGLAPGSGRVFTCLMQVRSDKLSAQCKMNILRRQRLITQDYRVSKGLMRACKDDIRKSHCRRQTSGDKTVRLAQILLCLESVAKNGTKLDGACEAELLDHRKMLMEDYRLSPEIVSGCKKEIDRLCDGVELGGKTIHCLMDHARLKNVNKKIDDVCQRALETLIKETDVGEDWRVDPVLHEACDPVVKTVCRDVKGGDARVISCLMDNIGTDHMTEDCENALIQIQYFVARDFKLDPQLHRACKSDASRLCHADGNWEGHEYDPSNAPLVLPCLYRYAYHIDETMQLNRSCLEQIRRVMRQRAVSVDLIPEVEEVCLDDLGSFCFDKTMKGEEMQCLQKNLDDLKDECHDAVVKFTEVQAASIDLNPYIKSHCSKLIDQLCSYEAKNDDGSVMECLVSHKNHPTVKANSACRASIEHFQIISLKDYRFSYKFKVACKRYALRFCASSKSKSDVVRCLSEKLTNDTINGVRSDIQKDCRQQLKAQLFQQRENIDFDPKLKEACEADIKLHCRDVQHGQAQVLECLQSTFEKLSEKCEREIFNVKKQEVTDNSVDYALMSMCEEDIQHFCANHEREHILDCLKSNKDQAGFNKKCRLVVLHRMIEQNSNYRLNPTLQENCKLDIKKFCFNTLVDTHTEKDMNGPVIRCLKSAFKHSKLSARCEKQMATILREQALDINLNPLLRAVCKVELETVCAYDADIDVGVVEECLKNALMNKRIPTPACQVEVAGMIEESQADIQVDPLLQQTCALDLLKYCDGIPQGNGRHIKCLQVIMSDRPKQLTTDCRNMLTKRLEMYKNAAEYAPPEDMQQLLSQVVSSPAKHYLFLMIFMFVGVIFVVGIFCGRVSRRHMLLKNK